METEKYRVFEDSARNTLVHEICRGAFGMGESPLAPDGSRRLSEDDQLYWKTLYTLNTNAYVVNPRSLSRILSVLEPSRLPGVAQPIDVQLAESMINGKLKAYMPTREFCTHNIQLPKHGAPSWLGYIVIFIPQASEQSRMAVEPAQGLKTQSKRLVHPALSPNKTYEDFWQQLFLPNCMY